MVIFRDFISEMFLSLLLCTFFGTTIAMWPEQMLTNFLVTPCIIIDYFPRSGKAHMCLFPGDKWEHYASGSKTGLITSSFHCSIWASNLTQDSLKCSCRLRCSLSLLGLLESRLTEAEMDPRLPNRWCEKCLIVCPSSSLQSSPHRCGEGGAGNRPQTHPNSAQCPQKPGHLQQSPAGKD